VLVVDTYADGLSAQRASGIQQSVDFFPAESVAFCGVVSGAAAIVFGEVFVVPLDPFPVVFSLPFREFRIPLSKGALFAVSARPAVARWQSHLPYLVYFCAPKVRTSAVPRMATGDRSSMRDLPLSNFMPSLMLNLLRYNEAGPGCPEPASFPPLR
jgi:hypothetical protein